MFELSIFYFYFLCVINCIFHEKCGIYKYMEGRSNQSRSTFQSLASTGVFVNKREGL